MANQVMPFPNNYDPRTDFVNRWPSQLPSSGIMNDLKPQISNAPKVPENLPLILQLLRGQQ